MMYVIVILVILTSVKSSYQFSRYPREHNNTITNHHLTTGLNQSENVFKNVCGDIHTKKQFVLESEGYPNNYPPNLDCTYLIKGPICPTYFNFQFLDFNIEESVGCTKDRLEVQDLDALCGKKENIKMYFSRTGTLLLKFKTDSTGYGKGFRILITRLPCNSTNPIGSSDIGDDKTTTEAIISPDATTENLDNLNTRFTSTTLTPSIDNRIGFSSDSSIAKNNIKPNVQQCCSNRFNSKTFLLTSPNFPNSFKKPTDCYFEIHKANPNICRLRIHFLFFYLGEQNSTGCPEGYLQIDGKFICGCKMDLKLISPFNRDDSSPKLLRFHTDGSMRNSYSGFILEVIQDECPKKYSPGELDLNLRKDNEEYQFRFYNDQVNKVAWPNDTQESFIERLRLINEKTEILDDRDIQDIYVKNPRVIKHVYYFAAPDYNDIPLRHKEVEETEYIDTSSLVTNSIVSDKNSYYYCLNWNQMKFGQLYNRFRRNIPQCQINQVSMINKNKHDVQSHTHHHNGQNGRNDCVELNYLRGYFRSPGYPFYYPANLNVCYRFRKQPGFCAVKIYMNDFQVERSLGCTKDYLLTTNQHRFCGIDLFNTVSTLDLTRKEHEDVRFVTDSSYCARGFSGVYEQIACQDMGYPIYPVNPTTPDYKPTPPVQHTTPPMNFPCGGLIQDELFTIDVRSNSDQVCNFHIRIRNPNVCKVEIYFENFDLICASESLSIRDREYCGQLGGRSVSLDVYNDQSLEVVYKKNFNEAIQGLRLRLRGRQIIDDCPYVPAQRLINARLNSTSERHSTKSNLSISKVQSDTKFVIAALDRNFKDICGIVTNRAEGELPDTFCDILMNNKNITKCVRANENTISAPLESQKIELKVDTTDKIEEVEFQEIDCDNLA